MNYIFAPSHEYNLDHKPFPIEIGHLMPLMHLSKTDFLLKTLGVLPTHEIFCQAPSAFYLGKSNVSKLLAIIHQLTAITFDKELLKKLPAGLTGNGVRSLSYALAHTFSFQGVQ